MVLLLTCELCAGSAVTFEGERPVNSQGLTRLARSMSDSVAIDSLQTVLANHGYFAANVRLRDTTIVITAGPRYYLYRLILHGVPGDTIELSPQAFTSSVLQSAIKGQLARLDSAGYFFASARVDRVATEDSLITAYVSLSPGPEVSKSDYRFVGLERSRSEIIERFLPDLDTAAITSRFLDEVESRAAAIPFVRFEPPVDVVPKEGYKAGDLQLTFTEKQQLRFEGGVGYLPSTSTGLLWSIDFTLRNMFGGGRQAQIRSERRESGRNLLDVGYSQPVFLSGVGEASGRIATRDYRDQFYEFAVDGRYDVTLTPQFSAGVSAGWRNVEPSSNLAGYRAITAGFAISAQSASHQRRLPRYGIDWTIDYTYRRYRDDSGAVIPEQTAFNETRTSIRLRATVPLASPLVWHTDVNYVGLETAESLPPLSELYLIGGPGTLRGFRNEQFAAQRSAYGSVEPRVLFSRGYVYLFGDGAYINRPETNMSGEVVTDESFEVGYGIGIELSNARQSVDISFGWNEALAYDEPRLSVQLASGI